MQGEENQGEEVGDREKIKWKGGYLSMAVLLVFIITATTPLKEKKYIRLSCGLGGSLKLAIVCS